LIALLTACSGNDEPTATGSATATTSSAQPTALPPINAKQVVAALAGAGYKCTTDAAYAICTSGGASVWVLTGSHPRPPVVSLHASGPVETASAEIAKVLPRTLELAHINQGPEIAAWFAEQKGTATAQRSFGDWRADYSAEVDTEEPGTHLTLTDTLCKANCQAE
jgi:hypothetical protein